MEQAVYFILGAAAAVFILLEIYIAKKESE